MLVNEHPKQGISTQVALADGTPVAGARLDLLNGTEPAAFDGTLELAPYESCIVVLGATGSAGAQPLETKPHASTGPGRLPSLPLAPMPLASLLSLQTCTTFPRPSSPARPAHSATRPPLSWAKRSPAPSSTLARSLRPQPSPSTANPSAPVSVRLTALRSARFWPVSTRLRSTSSTPSITPSPTYSA